MKNKKELEQRSYSFEVRAEETERGKIITGRPIVYNSRTDIGPFDEIIESGALDNADLTDVRFLVNHDFITNSTLRLNLSRNLLISSSSISNAYSYSVSSSIFSVQIEK